MIALAVAHCSVLSVSYRLARARAAAVRPEAGVDYDWRAVLVGLERTPTPPGFVPGRPWWRWTFGFVLVPRWPPAGLR